MDDLISRQTAISEIEKYTMTSGVRNQYTWNECVSVISETISELPPAQPQRMHGRWIDDGTELGCACPKCGVTLDDYFDGDLSDVHLTKIPHFCPNCGADMRGDENG